MSRQRFLFFGFLFLVLVVLLLSRQSPLHYERYFPVNSQVKRHNAVIFMLCAPSRMQQALLALRNVEDRFNKRAGYPYVLFLAEGETVSEDMRGKIDWATGGKATFATVSKDQWGVPESYDMSLVEHSLQTIGFSTGYRSMCRFYSGFFWKQPAVASYEWLWRLDTDIEFHCDIPYDPIDRLVAENALYGFIQISDDGEWVQPTLASNISHFMATNQDIFPASQDANYGFVWKGREGIQRAFQGTAGNEEWTKHCMYNNFEISHRSIWESKVNTRLFDYLDKLGGFFYERWSDAPIHSFIVAMTLKRNQVVHLKDLGYQHQGWPFDCPEHLHRCTCRREGELISFNDHADQWFHPPA